MYILDCHCHLDQYKEPMSLTDRAAKNGVFLISMTNLPSHFRVGLPHVRNLKHVRLALGLHPLINGNFEQEKILFKESLRQTSYIGEVGLDFSREGIVSREIQLDNFRFVLSCVSKYKKLISLHSRGAESLVLETLLEFMIQYAIFHWYTGPLNVLDTIVSYGHFFSVNPAMVKSEKGKRIIERIPPERLLTETDGPYIRVSNSEIRPGDVEEIERYLSIIWGVSAFEVRSRIWSNFSRLIELLGISKTNPKEI